MKEEIKDLITKYNQGQATSKEVAKIEEYLERGEIEISVLNDLDELADQFKSIPTPEPSERMTSAFYSELASQKSKGSSFSIIEWIKHSLREKPSFQLAYTMVLLLVGLLAGYLIKPTDKPNTEIEQLSAEVTEMKEMMMLSLLEKESTSDRLKAVNLTSELPEASKKITTALIKTLNNDENVNVRLATIDALYPYAGDPSVRQGLINSIAQQESPLVQIALAEMMVALQEKSSVNELEQILDKEETPIEVKERIKESIDILI